MQITLNDFLGKIVLTFLCCKYCQLVMPRSIFLCSVFRIPPLRLLMLTLHEPAQSFLAKMQGTHSYMRTCLSARMQGYIHSSAIRGMANYIWGEFFFMVMVFISKMAFIMIIPSFSLSPFPVL